MKKSTIATQKLESLSAKTLISRNETRWNSQLKMVQRVLEVKVNDVVEKKDLHLSAFDKNLQRFVESLNVLKMQLTFFKETNMFRLP